MAVGGLGAGYLYQTHMMIGAFADLLQKGELGPEEVEALMGTTLGMGDNVSEVLAHMSSVDLAPNDRATLDQMLEVNGLLGEQAHALKTLARDRSPEKWQEFASMRETTWVRLRALLNIRPK
jgi:hypothetical protein